MEFDRDKAIDMLEEFDDSLVYEDMEDDELIEALERIRK